jgi:hypothetical protein
VLKIRGTRKKTLHEIYTPEELEQLADNYYQFFVRNFNNNRILSKSHRRYMALIMERNTVILSILVNQGVITTEISKIESEDVNLMKATIKIR